MWKVFDNNKPAILDTPNLGWDKCSFPSLKEARGYARNWLGQFAPEKDEDLDYCQYIESNTLEIREVLDGTP